MGILTIVLVARIAARLAAVDVPIPLSFATTSFVLGVLIAICAVLKLLTDDYRNFWAFIGVGLAIAVAIGAWLEVQEAGGIESLKSDASSLQIKRLCDGCPPPQRPTHLRPRLRQRRRPPRCLQQRIPDTVQERLRRARPRTWPRKQPARLQTRRMRPRTQQATSRRPSGRANPLEPTKSAAAQGRAAADTCAGRRFKAPANAPFHAFPSTL